MKFLVLLAVLCTAYAAPKQPTHIVVLDPKPADSSSQSQIPEEDPRQSKRSVYNGGCSTCGSSFPSVGYGAPAPVALPAEAGFASSPVGIGGADYGAAAPGVGLLSDPGFADSAALGSGYAPSYPSYPIGAAIGNPCAPPLPPVQCTPPPQIITQHIEVPKPVPVPVYKHVAVPVPQPVPYPVPQPVAVKVPHPVPVEVPVIKHVPVPVEKPVPIPYPVEKPIPIKIWKKVPVFIPKPYPVHIYKVKHIYHKTHHSKGWGWD